MNLSLITHLKQVLKVDFVISYVTEERVPRLSFRFWPQTSISVTSSKREREYLRIEKIIRQL